MLPTKNLNLKSLLYARCWSPIVAGTAHVRWNGYCATVALASRDIEHCRIYLSFEFLTRCDKFIVSEIKRQANEAKQNVEHANARRLFSQEYGEGEAAE